MLSDLEPQREFAATASDASARLTLLLWLAGFLKGIYKAFIVGFPVRVDV